MFAVVKWVVPVLALGLLVSLQSARGQESAEKGTLTGIVKDADGNAAAGAQVQLFHPMERPQRRAGGEGEKKSEAEKGRGKGERPQPVSSAVTDNEGKFTLSDIPAGKYVVRARIKQVGMARQPIEVKSGESATVELQLQAPRAGGKKEKPQ